MSFVLCLHWRCWQALETLVGLQGRPKGANAFQYTHHASGFTFELGPAPPSSGSSDDEGSDGDHEGLLYRCEEELEYNPIHLGSAKEVRCPELACTQSLHDS